MTYDVFLQSEYSNPNLKKARIAILKSQIFAYEEHGPGTKLFCTDAEEPIEIAMSFDEVKKSLTKAVVCVN